jgi:hypothetical protein
LILLLYLALAGCAASRKAEAIPARELSIAPGQAVTIQVNSGLVRITSTTASQLSLTGQLADPDRTTFQVSSPGQAVVIEAQYQRGLFAPSGTPVELDVQVPQGVAVDVTTFDAAVEIRDLRGKIHVSSTAGQITAKNLSGDVSLRSARGDVRASGCSGQVSVVGEAGVLSLLDTHGQVGSTTIMGTIQWDGTVGSGDAVHLETDHGPVNIALGADSSLSLAVHSTSGDVTCPAAFSSTTRECRGSMRTGPGTLDVRTVSGGVRVQVKP